MEEDKKKERKMKLEKWEEKAYVAFQDLLIYCIFQDTKSYI